MSILFLTLGAGTPAASALAAEVTIADSKVGLTLGDRQSAVVTLRDAFVMFIPPRDVGGGPIIEEP